MGRTKKIIFLWLERILARVTDKIICISESERDSAIKNKIANLDKLLAIHNGIDIEAVEKANPFKKENLGIDSNAYIIGMVGRITKQKAPDTFIKAAKLIKEKIPNAWFIIVGDGEDRKIIEKYAYDNNINLLITGWTNQPYSYLKMFDIAMLLSRWEGFGLAIVEYMVAKINFIATNIDAIPTIVKHKEDGLLIDVDSPEQAAKAAWSIYSDKTFSNEMKEKAYNNAIKKYNIQRVAKQHVDLFYSLIQNESEN